MTTDAHVARLRLTAPDEAHVRRGAILVEDALRIATLAPDADRRHYIVRHLDVGIIDPDAPPQTLALQIERRLAHVQATAVPAAHPDAATARAVYFPDELTAIAALVRAIAAHGTPAAWFWPHVADGAVKLHSPIEALRTCLKQALARREGPLALAAVIDAADPVDATITHSLLASLAPADGSALVRATFGTTIELAGIPIAHRDILATLAPRWRARLARWIPTWGADARAIWLAAIAAVGSRGAVGTPHEEVARARAIVAAILTARTSVTVPAVEHAPAPDGETPSLRNPERRRAAPRTALETTLETTAGGALFLLRPLALLGIGDWLAAHPWTADVNWPAQLLASIVDAYAHEDPLARELADESPHDGPFVAPARWRAFVGARPHRLRPTAHGRVLEAFGHLPLAAWTATPVENPWRAHRVRRGAPAATRPFAAFAWQRALARFLRAYAGLGLAEVVRRPAQLAATPTHLELVMPLRSVDARIRAAGLDLDPGWVPWLGRVVRFHYRESA